MKYGSLVELSAYAQKLRMFRTFCGKVGIVVETLPLSDHYVVEWFGFPQRRQFDHRRLDIKRT
jgi:hypothetical protein